MLYAEISVFFQDEDGCEMVWRYAEMGSSLSVFLLSMVVMSFRSYSICKHGGVVKIFWDGEKVEFWKIEGFKFGLHIYKI